MAKKKPGGKKKSRRQPKNAKGLEIRQCEPEEITTGLDPHLQEAILQAREGKTLDPSFSQSLPDGTVMVDVIARLKSPADSVDGLKIVRRIGSIVTGQVAVEDIEKVRSNENVASLKRATRLHADLEFSVGEINATPDQLEAELPPDALPLDGEGVVVGVVDYGGDFRHNNFRHADGSTRLLFLWDQRGGSASLSPQPYDYGREFDSAAIDAALDASLPYLELAYDPGSRAHGTHVMDIAAGNGRATGNPGVAPNADLIFVNVAHDDIDLIEEAEEAETSNFGNSKMLLEAVDYIFTRAAELGRPAVVNLSLGTHGGPHDGSTLAEQGFDELLGQPGRAITISAGNAHDDGSHAQGAVTAISPRVLTWVIADDDDTDNELEIWYDGTSELEVALETPSGQQLSPVAPGTTVTLTDGAGNTVGRIIHRRDDPNNHDNHVDIILDSSLPGGNWRIHVTTESDDPVGFHTWIERDFPSPASPRRQSRFAEADDDPAFTIGSISCGARTLAVGSYLSGLPSREPSPFTAAGPTRDGRQKPEISAPGQFLHPFREQGILAARSRSQGTTRMSGTSMASPHVAGLIALIMQAAEELLTIDEIREAVIETARRLPPPAGGWDSRYGFGRVDAVAAVEGVLPVVVPTSLIRRPTVAGVESNGQPREAELLNRFVAVAASAARDSHSRVKINIEVEPM